MDRVSDEHREFVITKHGTPVAKLVPFVAETTDIVGFLRGTVVSCGDLISPVGEPWDAG
jgi:antitoxin (DNA-binding transcriptional repressor) of toxin-antitoxin stability system